MHSEPGGLLSALPQKMLWDRGSCPWLRGEAGSRDHSPGCKEGKKRATPCLLITHTSLSVIFTSRTRNIERFQGESAVSTAHIWERSTDGSELQHLQPRLLCHSCGHALPISQTRADSWDAAATRPGYFYPGS